jgi:putative ABC transport system permease protein
MLQFLIEAATLSTLGGAIGVIFGLALSLIATRVLHMPFVVSWDIVLIAVGFSATIGIGFGFFPARKAAHLNPIEALRHE